MQTRSINKRTQAVLHEEIHRQRRSRLCLVVLLLFTLTATLVYGTLKDPFHYTFSRIGNDFPYREWYIVWALVTALTIQITAIRLFRLEKYPYGYAYVSIRCASFFLIVTALIPSLPEQMHVWHIIHKWTTFFYVISTIIALHPFVLFLGRTKPRLWIILKNWEWLILIGSMSSLIIQGKTGIFELWFIIMTLSLLMYLVVVLHGDRLEKLNNYRNEVSL
jgi:hypothetical protein